MTNGRSVQLGFLVAASALTGEGSQPNMVQAAAGGTDSLQHETKSEDEEV